MPKENEEKTKSAHNWRPIILVCAVAIVLVMALLGAMSQKDAGPTAKIDDQTLKLEIADTPDEQVQGLSGRNKLTDGTGMLFVFQTLEIQCFWMKDMRFNIDMTWLNEAGRVVHIEDNVSPSTYPEQFCPEEPSKYVLETNAGVMKSLGVQPKEQIELKLK